MLQVIDRVGHTREVEALRHRRLHRAGFQMGGETFDQAVVLTADESRRVPGTAAALVRPVLRGSSFPCGGVSGAGWCAWCFLRWIVRSNLQQLIFCKLAVLCTMTWTR